VRDAEGLTDAVELLRARASYGSDTQADYLEAHDLDHEDAVKLILAGQTRLAATLLGLVAYHEQRPAEAVLDTVAAALAQADDLF
jgi:hypothetical protein